jgi:hypothetical protein
VQFGADFLLIQTDDKPSKLKLSSELALTQAKFRSCLPRLLCIPHTLTAVQKTKPRELAESVLQTLESHSASSFHFLWAGNES